MDSKVPLAECQTQTDTKAKATGSSPVRHHPDCLSLDNVLGKHDCDCKPKGVHGLMHAQVAVEIEHQKAHYEQRLHMLRRTLSGLATNATNCKACRMRVEIIEHALRRDDTGGVCQEANCWCVARVAP